MVPHLVPEILSKCAFCDGAGAGAAAAAGIGDSRSLINFKVFPFLRMVENDMKNRGQPSRRFY